MRGRALVFLALVVPVGFFFKFYDGPGRWFVTNWAASIAYEAFFVALVFVVMPRPERLARIAVGVCLATIFLEFLQLWKPPWLQAIRSTFVGRSLLGNAFSWRDMPAYPLGCFLAWLAIRGLVVRPAQTMPSKRSSSGSAASSPKRS
jgi:hypothetical protein